MTIPIKFHSIIDICQNHHQSTNTNMGKQTSNNLYTNESSCPCCGVGEGVSIRSQSIRTCCFKSPLSLYINNKKEMYIGLHAFGIVLHSTSGKFKQHYFIDSNRYQQMMFIIEKTGIRYLGHRNQKGVLVNQLHFKLL